MEKVINRKVIYFGDMMLSGDNETIEEEFENIVHPQFKENGLEFDKVICTEQPPFDSTFDILLFDWGGASIGNDMLGSFCRKISRDAPDNHSKCYVIVSSFTKDAMEDAMKSGIDYPNVFLTPREFIIYWKNLK